MRAPKSASSRCDGHRSERAALRCDVMFHSSAAVLLAWFVPASAQDAAPNARYELAWRLRELERAWIAHPAKELRAAALPHIEQSVQSFFQADAATAAASIDTARALLAGRPAEIERRWPDGLAVRPERRLLDRGHDELRLTFTRQYGERDGRSWSLWLSAPAFEEIESELSFGVDEPVTWSTVLLAAPEGDYAATLKLSDAQSTTHTRPISFSIVAKRDTRLAEVKSRLDGLPENAPLLERETVKNTLALLESLARGSTEETDFPAARLLAETEQVLVAAAKGERWYSRERAGQFWLSIPNGKNAARVRVFVPEQLAADKPVPLVVALHGAGGSENMFFDAYGDGMIVELCKQRGWMLVAPRVSFMGSPVAAVIDALAERFPVDRSRLLLVGHSMGAGVGQGLVAKDPKMFRAFAALGGGSGLKDASALGSLPVFIGAGERDFGRRGAEALHKSLLAAKSEVARLEIVPTCEHLMVVVDALPQVFTWFDAQLK